MRPIKFYSTSLWPTILSLLLLTACGGPAEVGQFDSISEGVSSSGGDNPGSSGSSSGGDEPTQNNESFTQQGTNTPVDILWNIDTSGSMQGEQQALANNFAAWVSAFIMSPNTPDFQMNVTSTDSRNNISNCLGDGNMLITQTDEDLANDPVAFENLFRQQVQLGFSCQNTEKHMRNILRATQRTNFVNSAFFRPGAALIAIMVGDEDDDSVYDYPVDTYISQIKQFKGNAPVIFHCIVKMPGDNLSGSEQVGTYQMKACNGGENSQIVTPGLIGSIDSNFASLLSDIGTDIVNVSNSFSLAFAPILTEPISVKIDNVVQNSGYSINGQLLTFTAPPPVGSIIEVDYWY